MEINRGLGGWGPAEQGSVNSGLFGSVGPHAFPPTHTNSNEGEILRGGHRDLWVHF